MQCSVVGRRIEGDVSQVKTMVSLEMMTYLRWGLGRYVLSGDVA